MSKKLSLPANGRGKSKKAVSKQSLPGLSNASSTEGLAAAELPLNDGELTSRTNFDERNKSTHENETVRIRTRSSSALSCQERIPVELNKIQQWKAEIDH